MTAERKSVGSSLEKKKKNIKRVENQEKKKRSQQEVEAGEKRLR